MARSHAALRHRVQRRAAGASLPSHGGLHQLQIGSNGPTFADTRFFDDLVVGFKLHVKDQSPLFPSLSWSLAIGFPLGNQPYDLFLTAYLAARGKRAASALGVAGAVDGGLIVALTYTPKPWVDAGCNVGYFQSQRPIGAFAGITLLPVRLWR